MNIHFYSFGTGYRLWLPKYKNPALSGSRAWGPPQKRAYKKWCPHFGEGHPRQKCSKLTILTISSLKPLPRKSGHGSPEFSLTTRAFQRKVDIFHQNAFAELKKESSKLRTYGIIKQNQGIEKYLLADIKPDHRLAMTKLRLSNHDLMIEIGRHQTIDKNFRFCPFCPTHIESEKHFMLNCTAYISPRDTMKRAVVDIIPQFPFLSEEEKFITLLSDEQVMHISATYIHNAFEIRKFLTNNHKNSDWWKVSHNPQPDTKIAGR